MITQVINYKATGGYSQQLVSKYVIDNRSTFFGYSCRFYYQWM